uniref:E3 ubiquitin-protein ligase TRIM21-like n=1 Tax=Solea senegalensis TaxID=28829 RepID=UPI001CD86027|nr:E3 ubiquitin-protein ligase TRIM21-like [Solea senegalensis]
MAASCYPLSEDQFVCSICLDVFTDPVATPCGHNFCKKCITKHWDVNVPCKCPMCKETFYTRPELHVNSLISQMAAHFKKSDKQEVKAKNPDLKEILGVRPSCNICTGTKKKATKSCLICMASYCETHLQPHLTAPDLRKHQLVPPRKNQQRQMCLKHDKPLEVFCKKDQLCVCMMCTISDHKMHDVVPVTKEYEEKKNALGKTKAEVKLMIQKRQLKIQQIKHTLEFSKKDTHRETADGILVLTALKDSVDRALAEYTDTINDKQESTEKRGEGLIMELEQEISNLIERSDELEKISHSEDQIHFLQGLRFFNDALPTKDWSGVIVKPPLFQGMAEAAVTELKKKLDKEICSFFVEELKKVQDYATDVTFDPNTANSWLVLSEDGKQVRFGDVNRTLPDTPKRFSYYAGVLGNQGFSSGRFYFEVQVAGKTKWDLGVAKESINRKGQVTLDPQHGFWTISLRNENEHKTFPRSNVHHMLKLSPQKVGVFVDYEEGLISFYDVYAAVRIHSFPACSFSEKIYPFFNPCNNDNGRNSAPLIICPVPNTNLMPHRSGINQN